MRAPRHLDKVGQKFWRELHAEFSITDAHDLKRVEIASSCLDRITELETVIKTDGTTITDRFDQIRAHPLLQEIRQFKALFLKAVRELNLDSPLPDSNRPPRIGG